MELVVKNLTANAGDWRNAGSILGSGRSPGGGNATSSGILAWKIPWTEKPGGLQSTWLQRVGHNWMMNIHDAHNRYMTYKTIDQYFHNLNLSLCTFHCSKTFVKMQVWLFNHEKIIHTNVDNEIEQRETVIQKSTPVKITYRCQLYKSFERRKNSKSTPIFLLFWHNWHQSWTKEVQINLFCKSPK